MSYKDWLMWSWERCCWCMLVLVGHTSCSIVVGTFWWQHTHVLSCSPEYRVVYFLVLPLLFLLARFPEFESSPDNRAQDVWVNGEPGRLPAVGDDVCKLPEASWLFQHRDHEGKTVNGGTGGPAVFSPVLISHIHKHTHIHVHTKQNAFYQPTHLLLL